VATGLLFAVSAVFQPNSLGSSALAALWPFAAVLILAAVGQTLVVQQRGIDLSVPGFISLTVILVTHRHGWPGGADRVLTLDDGRLLIPALDEPARGPIAVGP